MRLAVTGPMFSGKSTFARYLHATHGYRYVNYTRHLKVLASMALGRCGLVVTVADIEAGKATYRAFLQDLGELVGFDRGAFVEECLAPHLPSTNIVFDNVRFLAQWEKLRPYGFTLVRFEIDDVVQAERAKRAGVGIRKLRKMAKHPAEAGIPDQPGEIVLDGRVSPEANFECVLLALRARGLVSRAQSA